MSKPATIAVSTVGDLDLRIKNLAKAGGREIARLTGRSGGNTFDVTVSDGQISRGELRKNAGKAGYALTV